MYGPCPVKHIVQPRWSSNLFLAWPFLNLSKPANSFGRKIKAFYENLLFCIHPRKNSLKKKKGDRKSKQRWTAFSKEKSIWNLLIPLLFSKSLFHFYFLLLKNQGRGFGGLKVSKTIRRCISKFFYFSKTLF